MKLDTAYFESLVSRAKGYDSIAKLLSGETYAGEWTADQRNAIRAIAGVDVIETPTKNSDLTAQDAYTRLEILTEMALKSKVGFVTVDVMAPVLGLDLQKEVNNGYME